MLYSGSNLTTMDDRELRWTDDETTRMDGQLSDYAKQKITSWGTNPACGQNPAGNGYTDCSRSRRINLDILIKVAVLSAPQPTRLAK